jgi:tetraacyldisaccharide 4'-kinase
MRAWWQPRLTPLAILLLPLSWLFNAGVRLRHWLFAAGVFKATVLPVPVIVVGNTIVGGSGKTPLTIALCEALQARGQQIGVVSRGYGGTVANAGGVHAMNVGDDPRVTGDEPLLIAKRTGCPVFIGADRVAAAQALLAAHPQTTLILSDDGLQHLRLARDFALCVFDERGIGNGQLLPAGPLRERFSQATSPKALVLNGLGAVAPSITSEKDTPTFRFTLRPVHAWQVLDATQTRPLANFQKARVAAVAGIGNPQRFFATLKEAGLTFTQHPFPDHHRFSAADLSGINAEIILMTEKDALKCVGFNDARVWALKVNAQVDTGLIDLLFAEVCHRPQAA